MSSETIPQQLALFSPFDGLNSQYLQRIAEHSELVDLAQGKLIFKRGKTIAQRFYLLNGTVDLVDSHFQSRSILSGSSESRFALEETSPTRVSAVAKTPVQLLKVDAEFLDVALAWSESGGGNVLPDDVKTIKANQSSIASNGDALFEMNLSTAHVEVVEDDSDWMSSLLQSPLFFKVSPAHIQTLFSRFQPLSVKQGDVIIKEGADGDYFYVIDQGRAEVTNLTGKLNVTLSCGQFFGEEALVGESPRNATIKMLTDGLLMRLEKEDFRALLQEPVLQNLSYSEMAEMEETAYELIDVRLPMEYRHQHVDGGRNITLSNLRTKLPELDLQQQYIVTDDGGRRSEVAVYLMCQYGLNAVLLENADKHYS